MNEGCNSSTSPPKGPEQLHCCYSAQGAGPHPAVGVRPRPQNPTTAPPELPVFHVKRHLLGPTSNRRDGAAISSRLRSSRHGTYTRRLGSVEADVSCETLHLPSRYAPQVRYNYQIVTIWVRTASPGHPWRAPITTATGTFSAPSRFSGPLGMPQLGRAAQSNRANQGG